MALIGIWMLIPLLTYGSYGQDAVPYVVAGELVRSDPHLVYAATGGDLFSLHPAFAKRSCELSPPGTDCENVSVAFVSTPPTLPIAWALSWLGSNGAVLMLRLLAAGCLAGGLLMLRRRLASAGYVDDLAMFLTALALTPWMMIPLSLGQTSPLLFLSASLGVARSERSTAFAAGSSLVWVLATAFKAWPAVLVVIVLWQRRWRFLAWSALWAGALVILALPFAPQSLVSDFLRTSSELNGTAAANPYNGSLEAMLYHLWKPMSDGWSAQVFLAVRVVLVAAAWWWGARRASPDVQWALGMLTLLAVSPFVWWHYVLVAIAAVGVGLASRPTSAGAVWLLPAMAVLAVPISVRNATGSSWTVVQGLYLVVAIVIVVWLARYSSRASEAPAPVMS